MGIDKKAIAQTAYKEPRRPDFAVLVKGQLDPSLNGVYTMPGLDVTASGKACKPRCDVKVSARIRPALDQRIRAFAQSEGLTYSKALATLVARGLTR